MTFDNILTTVLTGLFWVLLAILIYELLRWAGRAVARKRAQAMWPEPHHARPKAPE
jgi:hypothetical protein